jgi:putative peptide maturation dehydrogenase
MAKIRRTLYAFFYLEDDHLARLSTLLRGEPPSERHQAAVTALAILTGQRHRLDRDDFELLMSVPAERWVEPDGLRPDGVDQLADKGLLLSDSADARLSSLRGRDEALDATEWNLYAALYHFMTQWSGVGSVDGQDDPELVKESSREAARAVVAEYGPPPGPFADLTSTEAVPLPAIERRSELYETLLARRTTRAFDVDIPMALADLDTVLRYVFGTHGYARNVADAVCIKRTSPSGGGLHPIDVRPIVTNVEGVEPGIYRYDAASHSLGLESRLGPEEGRRMITSFTSGQGYFGAAHVAFILTARFYRNHWKYRRHQKAYLGILMDAAHLSQTLYLVSAQLGLGAFVTIAINSRDIERCLNLDGISEGVIALTGCGPRSQDGSPLELQFSPDPIGR